MIDSAIYTNSGGAKNLLQSMQVIANNLSNINTNGFHADYENIASKDKTGNALTTRVISDEHTVYTDFNPGPINYTGRNLDVAIDGPGLIAVQSKTGEVGYTRSGSFNITPQGLLVTNKGDMVLGRNGVITVPPSSRVSIGMDGAVTVQEAGEPANTSADIGKIKLVEAPRGSIVKKEDGLYYPKGDTTFAPSENIKLIPESLEGSNVDVIRSLTDLIELSRQFDMNSKHIRSAEENADKANQLLNIQI